jgi:hypothetical protein
MPGQPFSLANLREVADTLNRRAPQRVDPNRIARGRLILFTPE